MGNRGLWFFLGMITPVVAFINMSFIVIMFSLWFCWLVMPRFFLVSLTVLAVHRLDVALCFFITLWSISGRYSKLGGEKVIMSVDMI